MSRTDSKWRRTAQKVIYTALKEMGIGLTYSHFSDDQKSQIERTISKAYPFGDKKYHPYKVWLQEVNATLTLIGVRKKFSLKSHTRPLIDDPRQMRLF